jgi:H+/Cl- antiporter ClcA
MTEPASSRDEGRTLLALIGLGALIGAPAALVASLFLVTVHEIEHWLWTDLPDQLGRDSPPWYLVVGLPVVGGLIVWVARHYLPGDGGHSPLDGLGGGVTPLRYVPGVVLAALGTLPFGAVLGPEAPLIALGSAVGVSVAPLLKLDTRGRRVVGTAGSFSAISALFGGPLVAAFLLLEGGLAVGTMLVPALLPGLVAAAVGYLLFTGLGDWGGLDEAGLAVPDLPTYEGTHVIDLLLAIVVGVLTALVITFTRRMAERVDEVATRERLLPSLLVGGFVVGLLAYTASLMGAETDQVLFSGQAAVPSAVAETSLGVLLVILVAKSIGYAVCLGCGFRGGPVFPAIFLGTVIATFAVVIFDTSPTWAVAVGAAAGVAAGTHLIFSGLLFSMLLVGIGGLDALPAAVFAGTAAWLTREALPDRPRVEAKT